VFTQHFVSIRTLAVVALALLMSGAAAMAHPSIDIVAANWHFTPSTITVEAGQIATLRLTSTSGTHGIASPELGIAATTIGPGRFVEVAFTPHTAGTFRVQCSIFCGAGHPDMVLTVIVTGATAATPAPAATPASAAVAQPASTPVPPSTPKPAPTPKPLIDDRHYIMAMVARERSGLQLAQFAVKSAHHPEIRALAKTLVVRDTAAIAQLKNWYAAWYGAGVPNSSSPMSANVLSGAPDLDRALIVTAIPHEATDASLSLAAEPGLTHAELRRFARSSAAAQMSDVQTLWRWYSSWYPEK
jgi:cytochrome c oxidase subunit 2